MNETPPTPIAGSNRLPRIGLVFAAGLAGAVAAHSWVPDRTGASGIA